MTKAIVALPIVASALIVGIVITLLWMAGSASGERAKFSSLEIAPKDADVFVAINTDPTSPQWLAVNDSLDAINTKDRLRRLIDEALAEVNLDLEEDILPVAGDEAFFSVPDISEMEDGGFVAGFRIRDTGKAREVFDSLRERAKDEGEEFQAEEYEGVTIYYTEGPGIGFDALSGSGGVTMFCSGSPDGDQQCACEDEHGTYPAHPVGDDEWSCGDSELEGDGVLSPGGAVALFEDILAVGGSPDDVKRVIDVVQGRAPSAEENQRLQEFREIQKEDFLVWGYADLGSTWDTLEENLAAALESGGSLGIGDVAVPLTPEPVPTRAPEGDFRVPAFHADYRIVDGALHVTERITVDFGDTPKHGIYRDFATRIGYDFGRDESIDYSAVSVTRNGVPEPFEETSAGDSYEVRFGDPNATITGEHTYEFQYTIIGGIRQKIWGSPDASYELRWIATGDQWHVPIEESSVTFTAPAGTIESTDCFVGRGEFGIDGHMPCQDSHDGLTATFVPDAPIEPGAGLHFVVSVTGESGRPTPVFVPAQDSSFESESPTDEEPEPPVAVPTVAPTPSPSIPRGDDFAIRSFNSEIIVDSSGSLLVTERIVVDFGDVPKHGIFRDIPIRAPYDLGHNEILEIGAVGVTRDGQPDSYQASRTESYVEVQIGDPERTITGAHEYVIEYAVHGGIFRFPGDDEGFYEVSWNVTGERWSVPIDSASATVRVLSGEVVGSSCTVGIAPTDTPNVYLSEGCEEGMPSVQSVTVTTDAPITPGTGLGIRIPVQGTVTASPPVLEERDSYSYGGFEFPSDLPEEPEEPVLPFDFDTEGLFDELRGTYDRVGFSVSAAGDGFAFDLTVLHAPGFEPKYALEPATVFDSHFAGSVPADTMFFFAGYDIYGQTKALGDYLGQIGPSGGPSGEDFLDGFTEATGLDLEEDILSLLTGEYAVAGNASGFENDPPDFSIIAMLNVNDAEKAQESLEAIGDFLEDEGLVDIDDSDAVQRWEPLGESSIEAVGVTIARGALIAGYPDKAVEDSVNGFNGSLADTEDWKRTLKLLPQDTTSVGFVSLARIFEELRGTEAEESFNQSTGGELTLEDWAAVRSVAFATTSRDNGFGMHFVLFMEDR